MLGTGHCTFDPASKLAVKSNVAVIMFEQLLNLTDGSLILDLPILGIFPRMACLYVLLKKALSSTRAV